MLTNLFIIKRYIDSIGTNLVNLSRSNKYANQSNGETDALPFLFDDFDKMKVATEKHITETQRLITCISDNKKANSNNTDNTIVQEVKLHQKPNDIQPESVLHDEAKDILKKNYVKSSSSKLSPTKSVIPKVTNQSPPRKNTKDSTKSSEVSSSLTQPTFSNLLKSNTTQSKDIYADEV